jgi:hypothetical protein
MSQQIEVPGQGIVEFPDGMPDDQISAAIKKNYPNLPKVAAPIPPTQEPGGPLKLTIKPMEAWRKLVEPALAPIKDIGPTYQQKVKETTGQMAEGVEQLQTPGERMKGAFNVGVGAVGYTLSPLDAFVEAIAGKPVEKTTGIPKEYTDFALTLGLPGVGFGKVPKTLQKLVSPETLSPEAGEAAAIIRRGTGTAARDTLSTAHALEPWQKTVNQLPPAEQLNIMHYAEGGGTAPATPSLRALADTLRDAMKLRRTKLESLPQHAQMAFVEDFFPHFWKDPNAAGNFARGGAFGKQGSAASTRARTIPTIEEGIRAGLEPLTTNPVEAAIRYITSMDKYIASLEMLNAGKASGAIKYIRPRTMGASGHPSSFKVPQGWAPLEGRGSTNQFGARAYAPEDWARVYNNFISRGFDQIGGGEYGDVYNAARRTANAITQTLLSFSGYHAFTMAEATMSNQMSLAVRQLRHGRPIKAVSEGLKIFKSPVSYAVRGKKWEDMYLGKSMPVSPQDKEIIDLITQAGGRMAGYKHALDYEMSSLGDYVTAFRRGRLRAEMTKHIEDIKKAPVLGTFRTLASNAGRIMDTFQKPLFQHYIPSIKNAAQAENLGQWIKLHPNATFEEKLAAARKVVDSVDNRFGEMIHDNIFWNKVAKQTGMLAMLSYSWNMGAIREIGGGGRDVARTIVRAKPWTEKADYVVGMTINWAIMSAIYQYLKTGEPPRDAHDLAAPRTGGIDQRTGEPERIIPPGQMKDVFGYFNNFGQEAMNKMNPGLRLGLQSLSILGGQGGSDWRGDPILSPRGEDQSVAEKLPEWLGEYFNFIAKSMSPIASQQLGRGPEEGSALTPLELGLGIRKAPRELIDAQSQDAMMRNIWRGRYIKKLRHEKTEQRRYGGPDD